MMKRLTFEGNFCDIAQCAETRGGSFCEDGACSPRMAAFIGYTPPGETKPAIKTSPTWCPMRPGNKEE